MKKQLRYSLLVVLAFALTISIVQAPFIGQGIQARPFESNPSSVTKSNTLTTWPVANPTMMYDGDLMTFGSFRTPTAAINTPLFAWLQIAGFNNAPLTGEYPIAWVDFKMRYQVPAFTDEFVRIEYSVSGSPWVVISPDAQGAAAKFPAGAGAATRPWSNLVEPNDGVWDWADIGGFAVRFYLTKGPTTWDLNRFIYVYEAWLTIYESAPPTTGSATVSLQAGRIDGVIAPIGVPFIGSEIFVDVYIRDVAALWGYQFLIHYDTNVLTAVDGAFWSYNIFDTAAPYYIDDTLGEISISFTSFGGDLVGFSGDMPLARIIFTIDAGGSTALTIDPDPTKSALAEAGTGGSIPFGIVNGWFSSGIVMSFNGMVLGAPTLGDILHELYPTYGNTYTLTSWLDNGDTILSASDQIDLTNGTGWIYWYHVDVVTTTIHFTFKLPAEGTGDAEAEVPMTEMPLGDPTGSRWHMVYPTYCRTFTITSWTDNDLDGNFNPSDQFDFEFDDEPGVPYWAHLDSVTTDVILSQKGEPTPGAPEFPLGISLIFAAAPLVALVYLWRTKPKKKVA